MSPDMGLADRPAGRLASLTEDPVVLIVGLLVAAAGPGALHLLGVPIRQVEVATAAMVSLFVVLAALRSPGNGLVLLFLAPALFNGEDSRPYFWLLEVFVYATLAAGLGSRLWRRRPLTFPHAAVFLLFLLATVASVPLTLRELWLQVQVSPWRDVLELIRRADLWEDLFYVRTVLNVASGIGLAVLAMNESWPRERVARLALASTALFLATTVTALACHDHPPAPGWTFTTVRCGGRPQGGFQGLGFNLAYYAEYALSCLPLLLLALAEAKRWWTRIAAVVALLVAAYTIPATNERAAYVLFGLELFGLLVGGAGWWWRTRSRRGAVLAAATVATGLTVAGLLTFTTLGHVTLERARSLRVEGDPYRVAVLSASRRMFLDEPWLGIGTGRFAGEYARYDLDESMQEGSLSAHNLYVQFLAEGGVAGLACFVVLVASVLLGALRTLGTSDNTRLPLIFLLGSLGAWLTYGLVQHMFLMRSMQVFFWIIIGIIVALSRPAPVGRRWARWLAVSAAIALVGLGAFRVRSVLDRPVPPGYEWGFQPGDGSKPRWTRGSAILNLPAGGRELTLRFNFPVAHVTTRPQRASVLVDGVEAGRLVFDSPTAWPSVTVPIDKPLGAPVLVQVRVAYTIVPADLGVNSDTRRFGVVIAPPAWR